MSVSSVGAADWMAGWSLLADLGGVGYSARDGLLDKAVLWYGVATLSSSNHPQMETSSRLKLRFDVVQHQRKERGLVAGRHQRAASIGQGVRPDGVPHRETRWCWGAEYWDELERKMQLAIMASPTAPVLLASSLSPSQGRSQATTQDPVGSLPGR